MILYEAALAPDSEGAGAAECTRLSMTCLVAVAMDRVMIPRHPRGRDMTLLGLGDLPLVVDEDHLDAVRAEDLAGLAVTSFKRAASMRTVARIAVQIDMVVLVIYIVICIVHPVSVLRNIKHNT